MIPNWLVARRASMSDLISRACPTMHCQSCFLKTSSPTASKSDLPKYETMMLSQAY